VNCCCEKLVAEVRDSSETQTKGKVRLWKPLRDHRLRRRSASCTDL
jgi:hypothetical protein